MQQKIASIIINTRFSGCHQYLAAPQEVEYLKYLHRHEFHVCVEMEVFHNDRELEFIIIKRALDKYLAQQPFNNQMSCEAMASCICQFLIDRYGERRIKCTVLEDGENGGRVYYES